MALITLLIATRNLHKAEEIRAILGPSFRCPTLDDLPNPPKVIEDAVTFAGNATKKALELAKWIAASPARLTSAALPQGSSPGPVAPVAASVEKKWAAPRLFALADDSGLEVDCLQGAPGVHSARFAAVGSGQAQNASSEANNAKLLRLLDGVPAEKRTARFRCVLALVPIIEAGPENASPVCYADETELQTGLFEGTCEGRIGFSPNGKGGFGYDPLFIPKGFNQSFAELSEAEKNRLSHRAHALSALKKYLDTVA